MNDKDGNKANLSQILYPVLNTILSHTAKLKDPGTLLNLRNVVAKIFDLVLNLRVKFKNS